MAVFTATISHNNRFTENVHGEFFISFEKNINGDFQLVNGLKVEKFIIEHVSWGTVGTSEHI